MALLGFRFDFGVPPLPLLLLLAAPADDARLPADLGVFGVLGGFGLTALSGTALGGSGLDIPGDTVFFL